MEDKIFNSWMAGFWEGEGSISKKQKRNAYNVSIGQSLRNDRPIEKLFDKIKKHFKGNYYYEHYEEISPMIKWQLSKRVDVINFIEAIYPYCHFRRKQLEDVLNDYKMHPIKSYRNVNMEEAKELRQEGKTYREIAKILKEDIMAVWRRLNELRYQIQKEKYYREVDKERKKAKYYNLKKKLKKY